MWEPSFARRLGPGRRADAPLSHAPTLAHPDAGPPDPRSDLCDDATPGFQGSSPSGQSHNEFRDSLDIDHIRTSKSRMVRGGWSEGGALLAPPGRREPRPVNRRPGRRRLRGSRRHRVGRSREPGGNRSPIGVRPPRRCGSGRRPGRAEPPIRHHQVPSEAGRTPYRVCPRPTQTIVPSTRRPCPCVPIKSHWVLGARPPVALLDDPCEGAPPGKTRSTVTLLLMLAGADPRPRRGLRRFRLQRGQLPRPPERIHGLGHDHHVGRSGHVPTAIRYHSMEHHHHGTIIHQHFHTDQQQQTKWPIRCDPDVVDGGVEWRSHLLLGNDHG